MSRERSDALPLVVDPTLPPATCIWDPDAAGEAGRAALASPPPALRLGDWRRAARAVARPGSGQVRVDPATASAFGLPPDATGRDAFSFYVRLDRDAIRLGPVIGLFLGDGVVEDPESLLAWQAFCLSHVTAPGLVYAFTLADVRVDPVAAGAADDGGAEDAARVVGRLWDGTRFREPAPLPRPDVIWKRGEAPLGAQPALRRLCRGRLFNERLSWSKAEVQAVLGGSPHIPEAFHVRLADPTLPAEAAAVEAFLQRGAAYLKPVYGSQGAGVARVDRSDRGCRLRLDGVAVEAPLPDALIQYRDRAPSPAGYLVQRAIEQPVPGVPADLRVMVQRGRDGRLRCTGTWARLAEPGRVVSNRSAGGRLVEPRALMRALGFAADADRLLAAIARGAVHMTRRLERAFGRIAEVGLDVMVDRTGEWWVLEANPRPGQMIFAMADPPAFRRMIRAPLDYAATLAGF